MGLLDALKAKLRKLTAPREVTQTITQRVAPKAQAMIRESSRTKAGNVPWFKGPLRGSSDIPTTVTAQGDELKINMVDWALEKENAKGLPDKMAALVREEARAAMKGAK
jgi:hypothetical protein